MNATRSFFVIAGRVPAAGHAGPDRSVTRSIARIAAAIGAAALLAGSSLPAAAESGSEAPRRIVVSAESVARVAPDRARVTVSVTTRAATAREAAEANARASRQVLERLRALVKAPGEVATAGYDLGAEYDYSSQEGGRHAPRLVGYTATNRFQLTSAELDGVGALLDAAVAAGATQVDSIGFYLADEEAVRRKALLDAGRKARAEAATVAESLGVGVGEVLEASTSAAPSPVPYEGHRMAMAAMDKSAPATEVVPGSIEVRAGVTVTFAVR
jgi:uncharacterized protein YggE